MAAERGKESGMNSNVPSYTLEARAADQRRRLHTSAVELRSVMREKLDVKRTARRYVPAASGAAALFAMLLGYGLTGMFTRH
jgi:hypothetical protein